jgi:HEPN domain-containing protein
MISKEALRELVKQKLKDADVLLANRRYAAAIYMSGYSLELAWKLKICKIFKFVHGFPESRAEFISYQNNVRSQRALANTISELKQIKIHDLNRLLFFSGVEVRVRRDFLNEWSLVVDWSPEMRYRTQRYLKRDASKIVNAFQTLIKHIL